MATGILAMLAKPKGGASKGAPTMGDEGSGGSEVGDALMEMFDALKNGDASGAELAFRRAKAACDDSYDEAPDSEGDSGEMDDLDL